MRKITFILMLMLTYTGFTMAQTIEDFESIKMSIFSGGANGTLTVIPNPDPSGINTSPNVVKMVRGFDGDPWAGWYATLPTPVDVTANKYVHVKIWKPRISPVVFKYEKEGGNSGDVFSMSPQTLVNQWEELVFDMSIVSGEYVKIVLIPDFETPLTLTEDITLYFDDLYVNNDPAVGSAPVQLMDDYEFMPLNIMTGDPLVDLSYFSIFPNPDPTGVNLSDYVIKFNRDKDGVPWGGFFSGTPIDVTTNKYMHVKVWKPRVSPIKFKIETGTGSGNIEVPSTVAQVNTGVWEDFVFDLSAGTGVFPTIVFMPDFEDPLTLTEDITIYFDDFILNNDPNPITPASQTINVDMSESGLVEGTQVFIAGTLGGIYGTWAEPGTNANNEMLDPDGDKIYSITMALPDGIIAFKFFQGIGWGTGDTAPGGDRNYEVNGSCNITYKWGVDGLLSVPNNPLNGKIQMYPNPVSNELFIKTTANISRVNITSMLGQVVGNYEMTSNNTSISTSSLSNGLYFVTFTDKEGNQLTQKLMKN